MLPASGRRALHSQARPRLPLNAFSTAAIPSCGHQQPHAIQRLRVISDSSSSTAVSAEAAPLLEWMHQRGCTINGVQLVYQHNAGRLSRELQASKASANRAIGRLSSSSWCCSSHLPSLRAMALEVEAHAVYNRLTPTARQLCPVAPVCSRSTPV